MFPSTKLYEIFIVGSFMIYKKASKISKKFNERFLSCGKSKFRVFEVFYVELVKWGTR